MCEPLFHPFKALERRKRFSVFIIIKSKYYLVERAKHISKSSTL